MKRRIHIDLMVDSEAAADNIISQANTKLSEYSIFAIDGDVSKFQDDEGNWHVTAQIRMNQDIDAGKLKEWIEERWSSITLKDRILKGSKISLHSCSHDESSITPCREDVIVVKT